VLPKYGSIPSFNGAIADAGESISAVQLRMFANATHIANNSSLWRIPTLNTSKDINMKTGAKGTVAVIGFVVR
jgi:hypothetical protein